MANSDVVKNRGRIHYVDPNQLIDGELSNLRGGFPAPLEDYCHSVDLVILYSDRHSCGLDEKQTATYHLVNKEVSILHGTNGLLTTNYTDVDFSNPSNNTDECLGIQSIDITYDGSSSYFSFSPSVSITFVDTRGISLMTKEESGAGSLFNSLFAYPTPIFKLFVKGFYGKEICYTLSPCKHSQVTFDSATGNAIIRTDFIGYVGGIYKDLPMRYIASAPFISGFGQRYWEECVNNGHFYLVNQGEKAPMITFPEFRKRVAEAAKSNLFRENENEHNTSNEEYDKVIKTVGVLKYNLPFSSESWYELNKEGLIIKVDTENRKSKKVEREIKNDFEKIKDYIKAASKESISNEVKEILSFVDNDIKYVKFDNNFNVIDNNFNDTDKLDEFIEKNNSSLRGIFNDKNVDKLSFYIIETDKNEKTISERLDDIISLFQAKKDEEYRRYMSAKEVAYENILEFPPTIHNIYRMYFAHMETFMASMYDVLKSVKSKLNDTDASLQDTRSVEYFSTTKDMTDCEGGSNLLPPFPLFTEEKKRGNSSNTQDFYTETIWPGDLPQNGDTMDEVILVESILKAGMLFNKANLETDLIIAKERVNEEKNQEKQEELNEEVVNIEVQLSKADGLPITKDMKLSLYLTLKELYDKWLCCASEERWVFNNTNSDYNRFSFIDTFYNDIGDRIIADPEGLSSYLKNNLPNQSSSETDKNFQAFDFLSGVASELCGGALFDVPMMYGISDDKKLAEIFSVIPSLTAKQADENKLVFLYNYKPSEHLDVKDGFATDNVLLDDAEQTSSLMASDGVSIPAFAVTFAKQNQSIFKNVNVTSDNPILTDAVIEKTMGIAERGSEGPRESALYGQNIYSTMSSAQYRAEVTMMGDAQILQLMYFQLNNIPFWKGTYIIDKVTHSITAGDMVTTFSGLRINPNSLPLRDGKSIAKANGENGFIIPALTSGQTETFLPSSGKITLGEGVTASKLPSPSAQTLNYGERIITLLQQELGWERYMAAGLVGCMMAEGSRANKTMRAEKNGTLKNTSGNLMPAAYDPSKPETRWYYGAGLIQWSMERKKKVLEYYAEDNGGTVHGKSPIDFLKDCGTTEQYDGSGYSGGIENMSLEEQIKLIKYEFTNPNSRYKQYGDTMLKTKDVYESTALMQAYYIGGGRKKGQPAIPDDEVILEKGSRSYNVRNGKQQASDPYKKRLGYALNFV